MLSKEKFDNPVIKFYKKREINLRSQERSVIVKDLIKRRILMKLKVLSLLVFFLIIFAIDCAEAQTYSLSLRYQPMKGFPSLQQNFGSTLAIAPFKDERQEKSYIGIHTPLQGLGTHFESIPKPLEKALKASLGDALSRSGIKVVSAPSWEGTPRSLQNMETDSILTIEIKKFWTEGTGGLFRTNIKTKVQLVIYLGVKSESKVFMREVDVEKEVTVSRSTPERVEAIINQILSDIFD